MKRGKASAEVSDEQMSVWPSNLCVGGSLKPVVLVQARTAEPQGLPYDAPGLWLWFLALTTGAILAFDLPTNWFVTPQTGGSGLEVARGGSGLIGVVLILLAGMMVMTLLGSIVGFARLVWLEPTVPIFLLLALVSTLWSAYPMITFSQSVALIVTALYGYWLVALFSTRHIVSVLSLVMALGTFLNYAFAIALPGYGRSSSGSWVGVFSHENPMGRMATLAVLVLLLGFAIFRSLRLVIGILISLNLGLMWLSTSKTALVTLLAIVGSMLVFRLFKSRRTLYGAIVITVVGGALAMVLFVTANLGYFTEVLDKDVTFSGRTVLWELSIESGLQRPFWGWGWQGFWQGWFSPSHDVRGYNPSWSPPHSHNAFIEYLLAFGVGGVVLGIVLFVRTFMRSARVVAELPGALGLLPISYTTYALFFSLTEFGVISRSIFFSIFVIVVSLAGQYGVDRERTPDLTQLGRASAPVASFDPVPIGGG